MTSKSISLRLIGGSVLWVVFALVVTGVVLVGLFRSHVERAFDATLNIHMEELLALSGVDSKGKILLKRHPSDPQFVKPLSGWYWELRTGDGGPERSRSLWDQKLNLPENTPVDGQSTFAITGPRDEPLRVMTRIFTLPEGGKPISIVVAGPASDIENAVRDFTGTLVFALVLLGAGLIAAVFLQVRYGLWPLKHMRDVLADIRAGRATHMEGDFASEIEPLADELNALLNRNAEVVARARSQAGDLAHALKTPLAVLTNEADRIGGETGVAVLRQTTVMGEQIDRHLSRARAAGAHDVLGARANVGAVTDGLSRTLRRIYDGREIEISWADLRGLTFRGEHQDLEEMLGNLMDNACKWADARVLVNGYAASVPNTLVLEVQDDGPGIPEESMEDVLGRGRRLDETISGSGLGLAIVCDIAELYSGSLELGRSSHGGLSARLSLPMG